MNRKIHCFVFWSWATTLAISLTTTLVWQNIQPTSKVYQVKTKQTSAEKLDQEVNKSPLITKKKDVSANPYLTIRADGTLTGVTEEGKRQREITIPETVIAIGRAAFKECVFLQKVSIPQTVTKIGELAFELCRNLREITIPESVTRMGVGVFAGCSSLTEDKLVNNSPVLFDWWVNVHHYNGVLMKDMSSINLGQYRNSAGQPFTKIATRALVACTGLREIIIHREVTDIGGENFVNARFLKPERVINYSPVLFDWWIRYHPYQHGTISDIIARNHIVNLSHYENSVSRPFNYIGGRSFQYLFALESITIPSSILVIGEDAFIGCGRLRRVNFSKGILRIRENAFTSCIDLLSVQLPSTLTHVGDRAFKGCTKLVTVGIFARIRQIGYGTFGYCQNLQSINLPDTLTAIRDGAFNSCNSITKITLPESIKEIGDAAFANCINLQKINLPRNLTELSNELFANCAQLAKINIPQNVHAIGNSAFAGCKSLVNIIVPKETKILGDAFISGTERLKKIYILGTRLTFSPGLIWGINQFVNFYVADSWLMSRLKVWGIAESRIHPIKPSSLIFFTSGPVVELKPNFKVWNEIDLTKANELFEDLASRLKVRKLMKKLQAMIDQQKVKKLNA